MRRIHWVLIGLAMVLLVTLLIALVEFNGELLNLFSPQRSLFH